MKISNDPYDFEVRVNDAEIGPDAEWESAVWSLAGWGNGAYVASASLTVTDDQGAQRCLDNSPEYEYSIEGGTVTDYRPDMIADAELGAEFGAEADADFNVDFDPIPYVDEWQLVVTIRNDGPLTLPVATVIAVGMDGNPPNLVLDRAVPAGQSWSGSIELPDLPAGNHGIMLEGVVDPSLLEGKVPEHADLKFSFWADVCYQATGPVDVLLR